MTNLKLISCAGAAIITLTAATAAFADDQSSAAPAAGPAPAAATPTSPPPPPPAPPPYPSFGPTLSNNANTPSFDAGPLGKLYVNADVSGLIYAQSNPGPDLDGRLNKDGGIDVSNAMVTVQKTDGVVQFVVQAGLYSFPALGTSYTTATRSSSDLFGAVPIGYLKLVPNNNWSFEIGQLPTLIGAESPFTYQNMNIERGLLWNQEPLISRGLQLNYSNGPWAVSASWNDGFYTGQYTTISGNVTYTFKNGDTAVFDATGNAAKNFNTCTVAAPSCVPPLGFATPLGGQSQGGVVNLIWNHTMGKWAFTPYAQYSWVPATNLGPSGESYGFAVLAKYSFTPEISLAGRVEYLASSGAANLLYGPGSNAWSITLTPTYQKGVFFARIEGSYVGVSSGTPGDELGATFTKTNQVRGMFEAGVLF
jgi:hypothetical protein